MFRSLRIRPSPLFSLSSSNDAWALITGSSDGIGKSFALELASVYNFNVVIHGRNREKLEKVREEILEKKVEVKIIVADASKAQTLDYHSLFVLPLSSINLTLLINNVGVVCEGGSDIPYVPATEASDNDVLSVINCNNVFLSLLTKHMIPLLSNKKALIVNISSTFSILSMPYMSYYSASKSFVNTFSNILNIELSMDPKTKGITCESLIVGSVKTAANREPAHVFHPTADTYVKSACKVIGDGTKEGTGYLWHAIERVIVWVLPAWFIQGGLIKAAAQRRVEYAKKM